MSDLLTVDVLVVGGGPSGLLTALSLLRSGLTVLLVEKHDKGTQSLYGRACILFSRTLEFLDQLGTYPELLELGFVNRGASTFRDGKQVDNRGWGFVQETIDNNTFFDYCLGIRQKYSEDVFRRTIESIRSGTVKSLTTLVDYKIKSDNSEFPILATLDSAGERFVVASKFLVGADGAHSSIRQKEGIEFEGGVTPQRWIRMDAAVETDIPNARSGNAISIESATHGNVLWLSIDHGSTRIGYALSKEISEALDRGVAVTDQVAIEEAKKSVAPYHLDVKHLDWFSAYTIAQRVASTYRKGRVLLAGDACHTHSSGAAQGMNTGVHDAVNLGWKLGGVVRGWFTDAVLDTYDEERRETANTLINIDKEMSSLIGGKIPDHLKEIYPNSDHHQMLTYSFKKNAAFTVGLGVSYGLNLLNQPFDTQIMANIKPGDRAPDVRLTLPSGSDSKRLYEVSPIDGQFNIVVFAGHASALPRKQLKSLREYIDNSKTLCHPALRYLTIIGGIHNQVIELLGMTPFGRGYFDPDTKAYDKYGIDSTKGAIVILRPDCHLGSAFALEDLKGLEGYFKDILQQTDFSTSVVKPSINGFHDAPTVGEDVGN